MSRGKQVQIFNDFTKGLITEASSLNFPENACTETWDCQFSNTGVVSRRPGFDYEADFEQDNYTRNDSVITEYVWKGVAGSGTLTFVVIQVGDALHFYEEDPDGPLSPGKNSLTVDLTAYQPGGAPSPKSQPCQYDTAKGLLFVTHPYCNPLRIQYNASGPSLTITAINVEIRDFEGLTSTSTYPSFNTRPTSTRAALDDFDEYNLLNRGWGSSVKTNGGTTAVALNYWDTNTTTMPALNEYWWYYLDSDEELNDTMFDTEGTPNTKVPGGSFILKAFLQERDVASGISGLSNDDVTSSYFRPKCVAFYAGRVFYAGVDYQKYNTNIYYSQILEDVSQAGYCYQVNDPTARTNRDLLDTDGGVISIPNIASVVKLFVYGNKLLVFCTNGIWAVSGSNDGGGGFSAKDYSVKKISSVGAISPFPFVDVDGSPIWWNYEGIWAISPNETREDVVQSLTRETIQTFFNLIPTLNKYYVKGAFDRNNQIVRWIYRSTDASGDTDNYMNYDKALSFNLKKGAFYPWTIDTTSGIFVNGIINSRGVSSEYEEETVTSSGATVTDPSSEVVTAFLSVEESRPSIFKYFTTELVSGTTFQGTWATATSTDYVDWAVASSSDGVSYESYLISGYNITGQAQRFMQTNYIVAYLGNFPTSSCFFQNYWDFASTKDSPRVSMPQQIYRNKLLVNTQQARIKVRGKGRSVQFSFKSEAGKPFFLHGWSTYITQNNDI